MRREHDTLACCEVETKLPGSTALSCSSPKGWRDGRPSAIPGGKADETGSLELYTVASHIAEEITNRGGPSRLVRIVYGSRAFFLRGAWRVRLRVYWTAVVGTTVEMEGVADVKGQALGRLATPAIANHRHRLCSVPKQQSADEAAGERGDSA
ncbi:hypothetical protein OPT61_g750 [Boeremia exigua]|uniref:Uncharacterized protein n=1 Tax=Boeremia exigua TaxID=749465 RepID=A0ACC2IT40_9PLEO|nr:hypothetical protein OPT61_g750 [Boeremia exigua]